MAVAMAVGGLRWWTLCARLIDSIRLRRYFAHVHGEDLLLETSMVEKEIID